MGNLIDSAREMRRGASLVTSKRVNLVNLGYIVKILNQCANEQDDGCFDCPDLEGCVKDYDTRCGLGEIRCAFCKELVPQGGKCSECGQPLPTPKKEGAVNA